MPSFEIPDGPTTIEASRSGDPKNPRPAESSATYSVTNRSSAAIEGRLSIQVSGSSKSEWFSVEGDRERRFGPGETHTAVVRVRFPPDVLAGDYPFRLRAVAVNDPDNDHAEGPVTTARLQGPGGPAGKSKLWLWLLIGALVLVALVALIVFLLRPAKRDVPIVEPSPAAECKPGFVPREASPADRVCVTPESRDQVRRENEMASVLVQPGGGDYGPNTCRIGFVWREAFAGDFVCVVPERRSAVRQENALAAERRL